LILGRDYAITSYEDCALCDFCDLKQIIRRSPTWVLDCVPLAEIHRQPIVYFTGCEAQRAVLAFTMDEQFAALVIKIGLPETVDGPQTAAAGRR
jgi:hypothetical protein